MGRRALRKIGSGVDLAWHLVMPETLPKPWDAAALFARRGPLEIEVGSGKGLFLARAAVAYPQHDFLGIELAAKYARFAAARLARAGLENARLLNADALAFFQSLPDDAGLAAVHVYFPDPWWKKRHRKRRVMNRAFVRDVERTLAPGSRLHFWTDVDDYFADTLVLIAAETRLEGPLSVAERPAAGDLDYQTHFERRTRLSSLPVFRAEFRKAAGDSGP